MANTQDKSSKSSPSPTTFIGKGCELIFLMVLIAIFAWIMLLLLSIVVIFWKGWGVTFSILQHLLGSLTNNPSAMSDGLHESIVRTTQGLQQGLYGIFKLPESTLESAMALGEKVIKLLLLLTQVIFARTCWFVEGSLVIIGMIILGLIDGLVQRDIRKFQAARESTLFFHRAKQAWRTFLLSGYFLFMVIPVGFNPEVGLLIIGSGMGFLTATMMRSFKKYV